MNAIQARQLTELYHALKTPAFDPLDPSYASILANRILARIQGAARDGHNQYMLPTASLEIITSEIGHIADRLIGLGYQVETPTVAGEPMLLIRW